MKQSTNGIDPGDRKARLERTMSADARKARLVVKEAATHSLADLADQIARATSEQTAKHGLQEKAEAFRDALRAYAKEELKADGFDIGWMGPQSGIMPPMPDWAPEHKTKLAAAWNAMLFAVNEATKVGVVKINRYRPIELQVNLGDGPKLIGALQGGIEWN